MKIDELRYNPPKPRKGGWYKPATATTPGATQKWVYDPVTKKSGYSETEFHIYTDEPQLDADGKPVLVKTYSEPKFRPRIAYDPTGKQHGEITRAGKKGEGHIFGTVGDWLTLMGATREDLPSARIEVLHSPEYQELTGKLGFEDISTAGDKKNGTITLEAELQHIIGSDHKPERFRRKVLANGQIRAHASWQGTVNTYHGWRPGTLHPFTAKTHPDMSPHERIVRTMRQSLAQIAKNYQNTAKRHFIASIKR